jgi:sigma-B regulation protein RsbU (phosphoserine phosphatase)
MALTGEIANSGWKQLLSLGEKLLSIPTAPQQSLFVQEYASKTFACKAKFWLAEPLYPLPGEAHTETIPSTNSPIIVQRCYQSQSIFYKVDEEPEPISADKNAHPNAIAMPVKRQSNLIGVLHLEKSGGNHFTNAEIDVLNALEDVISIAMDASRQLILKNWRSKQLGLVQAVSEQIINIQNLDELCSRVTKLIQELFDYYYVAIFTFEDDKDSLRLRALAYQDPNQDYRPTYLVHSGEGIIGHVACEGSELLAPDVKKEPYYRYIDCLPETKSEFSLPLKFEEKTFGVLDIQSNQLGAFHEIDVLVLRSLANNIALAMESISLYTDLRKRADQIETVVEFNHALSSILDLDKLVEKVAQLIQDHFGYPYVHVFTIHPVRRKAIYGTGVGPRSQAMRDREIAYDIDDPCGIIPWVAHNGKTYLANDVDEDPIYRPSELPPENTQAELAVPVIFADDVLGVIDLQSAQKNSFTDNDLSLLEALAAGVAIAMRNAILYRSEKWRVQVADSFREVMELISATLPLEEILEAILRKLEENLPCQASAIWLVEENQAQGNEPPSRVELAAARGVDPSEIIETLQDPITQQMLVNAIGHKYPVIRHPEDSYGPLGSALQYPKDYSAIDAPLWAGDRLLGILTLVHSTPGRYGNEAHDMTATFANYAAVAIQNARLYEEAQQQAWVSTVLLQVAEASQAATNLDELLSTMVRLPPLLIGVRLSAIFMWDDEMGAFILKNWYGVENQPQETIFYEGEASALARMNLTRSTVFIEDAVSELNLPPDTIPSEIMVLAMVPLLSRGNLMGAFLVGYQRPAKHQGGETINQQILSILQGVAHQTSVAAENLRLEEAREEEAYVTAVLLEVAQAVVSQNDLEDILDTIVHLMPILVGIDTCVIYLWDKEKGVFQTAQAYSGSDEDDLILISKSYTPGEFPLLDRTIQSNQVHYCSSSSPNLPVETWSSLVCSPEEELLQASIQPGSNLLLSFPLSVKGETLGVLLTKEGVSSPVYQERRLEIIKGIAQQVSLAIQNEQFKLEMVETQRLEQEIELARQSQQTFLPSTLPRLTKWNFDSRWIPARQVGGDFYDIIQIDKDHLGFAIADVADKGMPAALYMTVTRTLIRAYAKNFLSPSEVLEGVNNMLIPETHNGMFVTAIYAVLNRRNGKLIYSDAGHNLPIILRAKSGKAEFFPKGGMALGILENIDLYDQTVSIHPGDMVLFYTDGVSEAFSANGDIFGVERLLDFVETQKNKTVCETLDNLLGVLDEFRGEAPPSDDVTMLGILRTP